MNYIILALAVWRISSLLTNDSERGPWDLLTEFRWWARQYSGAFECVWCMSIWIAIIVAVSYWTIPVYTTWFCLPFALSAGAIIVDRITG